LTTSRRSGRSSCSRSKWQPRDFARKTVAELWLYPNGDRIFELSTKCLPSEAFQVATETRVYLGEHGIDLYG
jgi:hypothetical protein